MFKEFDQPDMKTLVVDTFPEAGLIDLKNAGIKVSYDPKLKGIQLAARIYEI